MQITTQASLALLSLFFLRFASAEVPWLSTTGMTFHDCKNECKAKVAIKTLKPFKTDPAEKNPLAARACLQQLRGQMVFKKIGKKERAVCGFSDLSSVEFVSLQKALEEKGLR